MEIGIFKLIIYGIIAFIGLIALGITYLIYSLITKKSSNKWIQSFSLIPIALFIFLCYKLFVPSDSFYKGLFSSYTEIDFPEQGELMYTFASDTDEFGDGTYIFLANIGQNTYQNLPKRLIQNGYIDDSLNNFGNRYLEILNDYGGLEISKQFLSDEPGNKVYILLLNDNESIIFHVIQW